MNDKIRPSYKADFLIVGAGLSGATFARLAADAGYTCHIIDKRNHIGGNCFSYKDEETNIEVHKYGPHIFHTSSKEIWNWVNKFSSFTDYIHRVKANSNGSVYSMPINLHTINQFFKKKFSPLEAYRYIESIRIKHARISNFEEYVTASVGVELYEAFYKYYTIKQWGCDPKKINISVAKRLPIRFDYNDNYFEDIYQGIPLDGYTTLFNRILASDKIKIMLNTDFRQEYKKWRSLYRVLVYSGSIDEYFDYQLGVLPYRTLRFERVVDKEIQGVAQMNYTDYSKPFTRITEYKWFLPENKHKLSIAFMEFSDKADSMHEPYYPIRNSENDSIFKKYENLTSAEKSVIFLGRLAEYRYYDMHQVIASAMAKFKNYVQKK